MNDDETDPVAKTEKPKERVLFTRRPRWRRRLLLAAMALATLLAVGLVSGLLEIPGSRPPEEPVVEGPPPVVSASGPVVPERRARLSFAVTGRVKKLNVNPGDQVKAGQLLAQLEPSSVQSGSILGDTPLPGTPDFYLFAPFDGTVGIVPVREWETVQPGTTVVALGDMRSLRVEIEDLSESDVGRLKEGQTADVTFESFPGQRVAGRLSSISPMNNDKGGGVNYDVVVEFAQKELPLLRWGMTAHVDIHVDSAP